MIENELQVRREVGECYRFVDLVRQRAKIKGQARALQTSDIFPEQCALRNVIRHHM